MGKTQEEFREWMERQCWRRAATELEALTGRESDDQRLLVVLGSFRIWGEYLAVMRRDQTPAAGRAVVAKTLEYISQLSGRQYLEEVTGGEHV